MPYDLVVVAPFTLISNSMNLTTAASHSEPRLSSSDPIRVGCTCINNCNVSSILSPQSGVEMETSNEYK